MNGVIAITKIRFAFGLHHIAIFIVLPVVGWWLFSDTYTRYAPSPKEDSHIRFAHFGNYKDFELWRNVIGDFESKYPGVTVQQEYVVGLSGHYNTKLRQQILSNTLPDVALVQLGPFHELADHFANLTDLSRSTTIENRPLHLTLDDTGIAAFTVNNQLRGLPISGGNLLIYCNLKSFQRASEHHHRPIPLPDEHWTIEDFYKAAKLLTCDFDGDGQYDQFGFWLPRWIYFLPFTWSFGATFTDTDHRTWTFIDDKAQQAISFYKKLAAGHQATAGNRITESDRVSPRDDEIPQLFQDVGFLTGKTAMCVNGPWFLPFLEKTKLADLYVVAPIPIGPAGRSTRITWDAAVMSKNLSPTKQQTAWKFMRFLVSKKVQDRIALSGRALPARIESLNLFADNTNHKQRKPFIDALSYSRLQPILPQFNQIDRAINDHLYRFIHLENHLSAQTMLEQLAQEQIISETFKTILPQLKNGSP